MRAWLMLESVAGDGEPAAGAVCSEVDGELGGGLLIADSCKVIIV